MTSNDGRPTSPSAHSDPADLFASRIGEWLRTYGWPGFSGRYGSVTTAGPIVVIVEPTIVYVVEIHTVRRGEPR